jgi:hypothetical protein
MKVKDFLENFNGTNHIKIYDRFSFQTHRYNNVRNAISDYGYFTVRGWTIAENVLIITIQTQF